MNFSSDRKHQERDPALGKKNLMQELVKQTPELGENFDQANPAQLTDQRIKPERFNQDLEISKSSVEQPFLSKCSGDQPPSPVSHQIVKLEVDPDRKERSQSISDLGNQVQGEDESDSSQAPASGRDENVISNFCKICQKKFDSKSSLIEHVYVSHVLK